MPSFFSGCYAIVQKGLYIGMARAGGNGRLSVAHGRGEGGGLPKWRSYLQRSYFIVIVEPKKGSVLKFTAASVYLESVLCMGMAL